MKFKADWTSHLHHFREREFKIVFEELSDRKFYKTLELGAGDGFQSKLLKTLSDELIATDFNKDRLPDNSDQKGIKFILLDAELVAKHFHPRTFDLVYSSNLMEHLPNVESAFLGIRQVLKDDGLVIHIMPTPWWRFFATLLHFPNKFFNILNRIFSKEFNKKKIRKGNNLKSQEKRNKYIDFLIPKPHGVSSNSFSEFFAFRKSKWENLFIKTGYDIIKIKAGPVSSGYGFGWDRIRKLLEDLGIATEYIYYAKKRII
jgi:SAM-dependent methyltransferase